MLTGLSGSLLSHHFAECVLQLAFGGRLGEESAGAAHAWFRRWWSARAAQLGPVSSLRSIWHEAAIPMAEQLGFSVSAFDRHGELHRALLSSGDARIGLLAGLWTVSLDTVWREAVRHGSGLETTWSLCTNGRHVRLIDTQRTYSRAFLQFDLEQTIAHAATFNVFWGMLRTQTFQGGPRALVRQILHLAARHGQAVNRSLRHGVIDAVQHLLIGLSRCGQRDPAVLFDESLTVVYRTLFLMFAEARGLVPDWHPLYRAQYTIESLRDRVERPGSARGLWETLQAIARLAHQGCRAGTLVVPAFNGRLFSPARAPIADSCAVEDEIARKALLDLSTTTVRSARTRIDYHDLGVEQLGAVYESVLEYAPAVAGTGSRDIQLRRDGGTRKSTGSFYTPQSLTDYVVRRTLHPLVSNRSADRILQLRVVDPAMGSAAFLVSACRYLAGAYERSLIREDTCREADLSETDRSGFRRQIAQRCLFGVDLNPTAVQLARLSLWLATLSAHKPLTFLDHRLVCGDSLLGASPIDIARQPPSGRGLAPPRRREAPLFTEDELEPLLAFAVGQRHWMAETNDETADVVREKERRLDALTAKAPWKAVADLWCSCWMWPDRATSPNPAMFASLKDELHHRQSALPQPLVASLLSQSNSIARHRRFFHWVLEFPEVYFDAFGKPLANPGFDAVLGNPPWDTLHAGCLEKAFFRHSGIYRHLGGGHLNRYHVFVERALMLARQGGRVGLLLPAGFATDHTAAPLRRRLMSHSTVDTISGFDNRRAIFPIHRSVRFMICTTTIGAPTRQIACRFGIDDPAMLEGVPDAGDRADHATHPISVTPAFLEGLTGDKLAIPELRSHADVRIIESIVHGVPRLGDADGWSARFGRELNATEDRAHFHAGPGGLPVLEGKHIEPFRAHPARTIVRISPRAAGRLLNAAQTYMRPRLAYRDVASSTNRLSLIAAILPAGVVTTHSLFCLKTRLSRRHQAFLCGMLNSFVANYLVRQVMTTHLGSSTVENLRVPRPHHEAPSFIEVVELAGILEHGAAAGVHARLQAIAARCYGLRAGDFEHVLSTFPLVEESERAAAMGEFLRMDRPC
jgi:hypothetical protein